MLEAGYLEEWKFKQTISGVPQGGVISPIPVSYTHLDVYKRQGYSKRKVPCQYHGYPVVKEM